MTSPTRWSDIRGPAFTHRDSRGGDPDVLELERPTWQVTHARAEALRQTRTAGVPAALLDCVVDGVVDLAVARSLPLTLDDPITEPDALRRRDGASVYSVPGPWPDGEKCLVNEH